LHFHQGFLVPIVYSKLTLLFSWVMGQFLCRSVGRGSLSVTHCLLYAGQRQCVLLSSPTCSLLRSTVLFYASMKCCGSGISLNLLCDT